MTSQLVPNLQALTAAPLDNQYRVETPEGIELVLRPAGLIPRALAFTIDLVLRGLLLIALLFLSGMLGMFGKGLAALMVFLVQWWYMVLFEVFNQGATPGKHWLGLKVVHDDGTPVGWASSLTRNLLRMVDLLPFAYTLGIVACLWNRSFKRLGDMAAGTLVVYREKPKQRPALPDSVALPPPCPLAADERRALIAFAERHAELSQARREELAGILAAPLDCTPAQAERQVLGIATGLLGRL